MTVDLTKHAREIGRALRNGKFEATPGGVLIDAGGMNLLANGAFKSTLYRGDEREVAIDPNLVVDQGLIYMLNAAFNGSTQQTAWYIGLFSGNVSPQANWTGANIVANATEITGYTIAGDAPAARPRFTTSATTTKTLGNTGNEALFTFDDNGPYTARGAFLVSASAKGSTTGVLMAATRFAADRTGLAGPDKPGVEYVITAADAG